MFFEQVENDSLENKSAKHENPYQLMLKKAAMLEAEEAQNLLKWCSESQQARN